MECRHRFGVPVVVLFVTVALALGAVLGNFVAQSATEKYGEDMFKAGYRHGFVDGSFSKEEPKDQPNGPRWISIIIKTKTAVTESEWQQTQTRLCAPNKIKDFRIVSPNLHLYALKVQTGMSPRELVDAISLQDNVVRVEVDANMYRVLN